MSLRSIGWRQRGHHQSAEHDQTIASEDENRLAQGAHHGGTSEATLPATASAGKVEFDAGNHKARSSAKGEAGLLD
jgi:hypothetical protein